MNRVKKINKKNLVCNFFDDIINIKNLDLNNMKIDEKSRKNILIYYLGYVKVNSVRALCPGINEANRYIEERNGNRETAARGIL